MLRPLRRLLVLAVVLLVVAAVADRVAVKVAERVLASQVQGDLGVRPAVSVRGFPFLTQVWRGRYDEIDLTAPSATRSGVTVRQVQATLRGVHVPRRDVLSRSVDRVPVDRVAASVVVPWAALEQAADVPGLTLGPGSRADQVRVGASVTVLGQTLSGSGVASGQLSDGYLVVAPQDVEVEGVRPPALVRRQLAERLHVRVRLPTLPYGLRLSSLLAGPAGLTVQGSGDGVVLSR